MLRNSIDKNMEVQCDEDR